MPVHNIRGKNERENYFRQTISFANRPGEVIARIYSDTGYELFINGRFVLRVSEWGNLRDYELTPFFQAGENLVAVRAMNASGHRGLALELAADGKSVLITDHNWKCAPEERWGWCLPGFDDSAWDQAMELDLSAA